MSRLTEKDLAILKARGKVKSLTTIRDFEMPKAVAKKTVKKDKSSNPNANHELIGKLLHTSWGYDMTINEFCKILEVSPTGKTVKCQMVQKNTNGVEWSPGSNGKAKAGSKCYGPVFRLKIGTCCNHPSFHGSYPYICRDKKEDCSFHMGYFSITSADTEHYENHCD
jgi:hypothetical protein